MWGGSYFDDGELRGVFIKMLVIKCGNQRKSELRRIEEYRRITKSVGESHFDDGELRGVFIKMLVVKCGNMRKSELESIEEDTKDHKISGGISF